MIQLTSRRLAALAATLAPHSAAALLRLLCKSDAPSAQLLAESLANRARADRLEGLAALLSESTERRVALLRAAAAAERPAVAEEMLRIAEPRASIARVCHPVLERVVREKQ